MKIYEYKKCSTCVKALRYLDEKNVKYEKLPIVEQPPTKSELEKMLQFLKAEGGTIKNLFNTSGELYRALKMSEKLKNGLSEKEAIDLLSKNGKLIKRPFLLAKNWGAVGFKPEAYKI